MKLQLKHGDCLEVLKTIPDNSIDSVVTDPPYGIGFMNKEWDSPEKLREQQERDLQKIKIRKENGLSPVDASFSPFPGQGYKGRKEGLWFQQWCEEWAKECLRVLKPGGHLLSFSAPRMYHRMTCGLEDAGFEVRDQIMWIYGSGFPKSHNIGKAVDKLLGNEREVVGPSKYNDRRPNPPSSELYKQGGHQEIVTKGNTEWEGWGTALKPAVEPICVARKPLSEKSVADNVLKWGTGGINIDESRIAHNEPIKVMKPQEGGNKVFGQGGRYEETTELKEEGRWPANIILDEEAGKVLDEQSDKASRFFYCPKASKKDRDEGLKSYIELFTSTIKIVYYTKDNLWEKEDQKTKLVDMDTSLQKVIEEYGVLLKNDLRWNIGSYGNYIMDQLKKDLIFTTEMETNSITILETLNLLIEKNTRIYIQELLGEMVKDIKFVKGVEQKNTTVNITIQNKDGYWQNVNLVELNEVWNINTVQGKSSHPTVKPTKLMEYLIRLVTPKGGTVLDPFMGSGSTGKAAVKNNYGFVGIEREMDYIRIAEARILYENK